MDVVSVIVPFLNEEDCLSIFCNFYNEHAKSKPYLLQLIFVDDGSTDRSIEIINGFEFSNCHSVKLISFTKNYGAHAAMRAGMLHADGDYITFVGADLQEPDDMVPVMYDNIKNGFDAVYIDKIFTNQSVFSRVFAALMRRYAVKNYGSGGVSNIMLNKKIRDYLNNNIELNSSVILQIIDAGFKSITIKMDHKERVTGSSKWTFSKKIKLFIDCFVAFSFVPIRLVSIIGILMSFVGFLFGLGIIVSKLLNPDMPAGYATLASLMFIGFGITNISIGIIAEYLWRTYDAARGRPTFIVSDVRELK